MKICSECDKKVLAKGLCSKHYARKWRHGDTNNIQGKRKIINPWLRFLSYVDIRSDSCWFWTGGLSAYGYGKFKIHGKTILSHQFTWFLRYGLIDDGYELDHLCHTNDKLCSGGITCKHRRCVNPDHLEVVTKAENAQRRESRKRL